MFLLIDPVEKDVMSTAPLNQAVHSAEMRLTRSSPASFRSLLMLHSRGRLENFLVCYLTMIAALQMGHCLIALVLSSPCPNP